MKARWIAPVVALMALAVAARADIYQWEWVDPGDPGQGKQESTTLCPDGAGVDAEGGADLDHLDLTQAYLIGADLARANFYQATLTDADLSGANLRDVYFYDATLTMVDLTDAGVRGASFSLTTPKGFTSAQLYSTAGYKATDLTGIRLQRNDLSGWNFAGQRLTDAEFYGATLIGTDFTDAEVRGASFWDTTSTGFTANQLYATASYKVGDLTGVDLHSNDLSGWNLAGQWLTDADFSSATLTGTDFTDAEVQGVSFESTTDSGFTATQLYATASYKAGGLTGIDLSHNNLSGWNLANQNLTGACFGVATLTGADLSGADLTETDFEGATLTGTTFTDAKVQAASFERATDSGFTAAQLYTTASYKAGELTWMHLSRNDLSGWNFAGQNLTHAYFNSATLTGADLSGANLTQAIFDDATLTGADFTDANVHWASFINTTDSGFTAAQLYATASYKAGDLTRVILVSNDLSGWNFAGLDLTRACFNDSTLTDADLSGANLTRANFPGATLTGVDFTDAEVRKASFGRTTSRGFTAGQLYTTASYRAGDLTRIGLVGNDLSGWNFAGQNLTDADFTVATLSNADLSTANLTGAEFYWSTLSGTDFADAEVRGASFRMTTDSGFTAAQLYATASYKAGDLTGISLYHNDLSGWNLAGQNLTDADFYSAKLIGTDFTDADVRGASFESTTDSGFTAAQLYATASYKAGDLTGIILISNSLSGWDFAGQNLTDANFDGTRLIGTDFTDAEIRGAWFRRTTIKGFTPAHLYSTASYKAKDLAGIFLSSNDLSGWDFPGQNLTEAWFIGATLTGTDLSTANLTGANFNGATLTGADFTDAEVCGASFRSTTNLGFTAEQLYATASYKAGDLTGIELGYNSLLGWNLAAQDLTGAHFEDATLANADLSEANLADADLEDATLDGARLSSADARGAQHCRPARDTITSNLIWPDGKIHGLDVGGGRTLVVRDYDGASAPLPIHVADAMSMGADGTLRMVLDADDWGSEVSFESGIPVGLGGTLELVFASGVDVAAQAGRTLPLFDWSGVSPSGTFAITSAYRWDTADLYTAGQVTLAPATLVWTGAVDDAWDLAETANWSNGGTPDTYYECDDVILDDTASGGLVSIPETVCPGSVVVDNEAVDFSLFGAGAIAGPCGLTKRGGGTLTVATANAYTGGTFINAGTVVVASDGALGEGIVKLGDTTGSADAALLVAQSFTVDNRITVQDDGDAASIRTLGGTGASGTAVFSGDITLGKDLLLTAEPGGEVRFEGALDNSAGCTLIKVGGGTVIFEGFQDHGPGSLLDIQDGLLVLNTDASGTGLMDDAHLSISVTGAQLDFGCNQRLDTLTIGDGGLVRFTGANIVVLKHLVMDGIDLGATTLTPEPATLLLLGAGLVGLLVRRSRVATRQGGRK